jgi:hypothetical protein
MGIAIGLAQHGGPNSYGSRWCYKQGVGGPHCQT